MLPRTPHHRRPQRLAAILAVTALFALTACGPRDTNPPPVPTPSSTDAPPFASDEEALAAAEAVYREYLRIIDEDVDLVLLNEVATEEVVRSELANRQRLADDGLHTQGDTALERFTLQSFGGDTLTAYACVDISQVRVLTAAGSDATPIDRPDEGILEVGFLLVDGAFRVNESSLWSTSC